MSKLSRILIDVLILEHTIFLILHTIYHTVFSRNFYGIEKILNLRAWNFLSMIFGVFRVIALDLNGITDTHFLQSNICEYNRPFSSGTD